MSVGLHAEAYRVKSQPARSPPRTQPTRLPQPAPMPQVQRPQMPRMQSLTMSTRAQPALSNMPTRVQPLSMSTRMQQPLTGMQTRRTPTYYGNYAAATPSYDDSRRKPAKPTFNPSYKWVPLPNGRSGQYTREEGRRPYYVPQGSTAKEDSARKNRYAQSSTAEHVYEPL